VSMSRTETKIVLQPLLVSDGQAAAMCGVGKTLWRSLVAMGRTPSPIKLHKRRLFVVEELAQWARMGCPNRQKFAELKKG